MRFNIFSLKSLFVSGVGIIIMANNDLNANRLSGSTLSKAVLFQKISDISISIPPPSSSTPKPLRSGKALNPIISPEKIKPLKPQEQSTVLNFTNIDQMTDAFRSLWQYLNIYADFNPKEINNPKRIAAYYNPAKNQVIVSNNLSTNNLIISQLAYIEWTPTNPLFIIGGIKTNHTFVRSFPHDAIIEMLRKTNPLVTLGKQTSQQKKELPINGANYLQRELVTSNSFKAQVKILGLVDLEAGKPLLSYGDNYVPIIFSAGEINNRDAHIDFHLFAGIRVSNNSGASELHKSAGTNFLIERYNTHFLKNPRYKTLPDYSRNLLGAPIYNSVSEVEAFAMEAQMIDLGISNARPYKKLIISGMLHYNPRSRSGFTLSVLDDSNLEKLLSKRGYHPFKLYNSRPYNLTHYTHGETNAGSLGRLLQEYENQSITTHRYRGSATYLHTNEWKLSSLREHQDYLTATYRAFPAFVEFESNGLFNQERYPSLVFPLFEDLFTSTSQNARIKYLSTIVDGSETSKAITYESILPLDYNSSLTINPEFHIRDLLLSKKIKGTVGLIPQFSTREELSMFSEYVYFINSKLPTTHTIPFVKISPVALYHPNDHNIALLESSYLGLVYKNFYRKQSDLPSSLEFISFSSKRVSPAKITLFSEDNFSKLLNTSTLLALSEKSYATSSEGFVETDIWSILFFSVSYYNESNSITPSPLIKVFKNVSLLGDKFLNRVDFFTRILSYDLLIPKN